MKNNFLQNIFASTIQWILRNGMKVFFILFFAFIINKMLQTSLKKLIISKIKDRIREEEKRKRIETLMASIQGTLRFLIWIIAILMILPEFGIQIAPILASLGILGLAFGIGAREVVSDFISGFFILIEGQIFVGDEVKIGGIEGKVVDFNLRRTVVEDKDGFLHFISNNQIKMIGVRRRQGQNDDNK